MSDIAITMNLNTDINIVPNVDKLENPTGINLLFTDIVISDTPDFNQGQNLPDVKTSINTENIAQKIPLENFEEVNLDDPAIKEFLDKELAFEVADINLVVPSIINHEYTIKEGTIQIANSEKQSNKELIGKPINSKIIGSQPIDKPLPAQLPPTLEHNITYTANSQTQLKPNMAPKFITEVKQAITPEHPILKNSTKIDYLNTKSFSQNTENQGFQNDNNYITDKSAPPLQQIETHAPENQVATNILKNPLPKLRTTTDNNNTIISNITSVNPIAIQTKEDNIIEPMTTKPSVPQLVQQVGLKVQQAIKEGLDQITVKLNPPALGKIDVEMTFGQDGKASITMICDNFDTMDLLQHNPIQLREALNEAGFRSDQTDLTFHLSQDNNHKDDQHRNNDDQNQVIKPPEKPKSTVQHWTASDSDPNRRVDIHA